MADALKLTGKELEGLLQRVRDEKSLTPEERELIREILTDAVKTGFLKVEI